MGHGAFGKKNQAARIGRLALAALAAACWLAAGAAAQDVISSRGSSASETGLGNLIADAVRTSAGADAALVPASLLRDADVKVPEMNAARVSAAVVDPGQGIAVLSLTGVQVREALERSISMAPRQNQGFLQVSGINFRYDPAKPSGKRVGEIMLGRKEIAPGATVTVAMPRSLASGGLGYFRVWGKAPSQDRGGTIAQAIEKLLSGRVDPSKYLPDGRIRRS